ncbi:MAG: hypothetical protein IKM44_03620 [Clostridia bacterium]|nr:hypothetical protein [Clostridia bacterium]
MKKKQKFEKSTLSARERKEMRIKEKEKSQGIVSEEQIKERAKRNTIYAVALLIVAVITIAVAITVPSYMSCNYMFERNAVAVIDFDVNGEKLTMKYELFGEDCPKATANFAFLAMNDFFDDVVVFDTQNSWIRFGGYTESVNEKGETVFEHRSEDKTFTEKLKPNFAEVHYTKTSGDKTETDTSEMLKYTLSKDNVKFDILSYDFALCSNVSGSSASATEFQINGLQSKREDKIYNENKSAQKSFTTQVFARPLNGDEATVQAIKRILSMKSNNRVGDYFQTTDTLVKIKDVRIYNYEAKWTMLEYENGFESYMSEINAFASTSDTWSKTYISAK